jgi:hypothetical protein
MTGEAVALATGERWIAMRRLTVWFAAVSLVGLLAGISSPEAPPASKARVVDRAHLARAFGKMALGFEPNAGQADPRVAFIARARADTVFLTSSGAVLSLSRSSVWDGRGLRGRSAPNASDVFEVSFVAANPHVPIEGMDPIPGVSNYLIGSDPGRWRTGVPHYARVTYWGLYPGVNLSFYGTQEGSLEYDLSVAPSADPSIIQMSTGRSGETTIDSRGDLVLRLGGREVVQRKPHMYQEIAGRRTAVAGTYVLEGNRVGFSVGAYDRTRPLVIDPQIDYSTYLGGSGEDFGEIHPSVDGSGHAFICGATSSTDFPVTSGAFQPTLSGGDDGFITEMNGDGSGVVFSTFLGGTGSFDDVQDCKVDPAGNVYIGGITNSPDLPVTSGVVQPDFRGGNGGFFGFFSDGFVGKLDADGSSLLYLTYLGGSGDENLNNVQIDAAGDAFVAGDTFSTDFPTTPGAYQTANAGHGAGCRNGPCNDEFVAKINPTGSTLLYSTYLGGRGNDCCQPGLALDGQGNAYVEGVTSSASFPTTPGALQPHFGGGISDAFVTKLNPTGSALVYSTYLGGSRFDGGAIGMAVDASGNAYVDGETCSLDFPVTPGAFHTKYAGPGCTYPPDLPGDIFVSKINPAGSALVYSTYLGGSDRDGVAGGPVVDSAGHAYVVGATPSTDFPVKNGFQPTNHGLGDVIVTELTADGSGLLFSSYLGGTGDDAVDGATLDPAGNLYLTGRTFSTDFPTTPGAFETVPPGCPPDVFSCDGFVTKISFNS